MTKIDDQLFGAVIDSISSEKFLLFLDQFTLKYIKSPLVEDEGSTAPAANSTQLDWVQDGAKEVTYTNLHHDSFSVYCKLFESRLSSILRQHKVAEDVFFHECQKLSNEAAQQLPKPKPETEEEEDDRPVSIVDLCNTLLEMVESVSSFDAFSQMMRDKQLALFADWGEEEEEDDGEAPEVEKKQE